MRLIEQAFTLSKVANATGVSTYSIKNWLNQGVIIGANRIQGGGSAGLHRQFAWQNVMEIAVAGALLNDLDRSSVRAAFLHASKFALTDDSYSADGKKPVKGREPGYPFQHSDGQTFLVIEGEWARVLLLPDGCREIRLGCASPSTENLIGTTVLNVSQVFAGVCNRLGRHPLEVLDEIYGERA